MKQKMKQPWRSAGLALMAMLMAGSVQAQDASAAAADHAFGDLAGRFYVSPMFSYTHADTERETGHGTGGLLALGRQFNPRASLELYGSYNRYQARAADARDGQLRTLGLAVVGFPFAQQEGWTGQYLGSAYGLIGVNYAKGSGLPLRAQRYDQNRDGYAFDLGLGYLARIPFTRMASLRMDARYRMNFVGSPFASVEIDDEANSRPNLNDVVLSVGLLIPIGSLPPPPPPPPPPQVVSPLPEAAAPSPSAGCAAPAPASGSDLDACAAVMP